MKLTPRRVPLARGATPCRYGRWAATRELLDLKSLAVDQSVAEGIDPLSTAESATDSPSEGNATRCFPSENETDKELAGVEGLFGPDGPHPFGAALRAFKRQRT